MSIDVPGKCPHVCEVHRHRPILGNKLRGETAKVAVKLKLKRLGKIRLPQYRVIVADSRTKRDGRAIEEIGIYHPKENPSLIKLNSDRVQYWLSVGAQPTEAVLALLKITGDWQKFKGEPGAEGTYREPEKKEKPEVTFDESARIPIVKDIIADAQADEKPAEAEGAAEEAPAEASEAAEAEKPADAEAATEE